MSNSLQLRGLQHARPPCPSPTLELTQPHVHWVSDAIQPSHPLSSPSLAFNLSRHQGLFQWVSSLHQMAKVLEHSRTNQMIFRVKRHITQIFLLATTECWKLHCLIGISRSQAHNKHKHVSAVKCMTLNTRLSKDHTQVYLWLCRKVEASQARYATKWV